MMDKTRRAAVEGDTEDLRNALKHITSVEVVPGEQLSGAKREIYDELVKGLPDDSRGYLALSICEMLAAIIWVAKIYEQVIDAEFSDKGSLAIRSISTKGTAQENPVVKALKQALRDVDVVRKSLGVVTVDPTTNNSPDALGDKELDAVPLETFEVGEEIWANSK